MRRANSHPERTCLKWTLAAGGLALVGVLAPVGAGLQPAGGTVDFVDANAAAGLTNMFTNGNTDHSGGAAWIDYNNDYWPDLFITNGSTLQHILYRNNGDGTFTDVSVLVAKPNVLLESAGTKFADVDNDGDSDLLVIVDNPVLTGVPPIAGGPNLLYVNQGNGTFVEGALAAGVVDPLGRRNICGGFADFDRDGAVDLYMAHWQPNSAGQINYDRLLKNNGDGTFADVTSTRRLNGYGRDSLTCIWFDADLDGWPDLFVGCVGEYIGGAVPPDSNDILYGNHANGGHFCDVTGNPHKIGDDATASMGLDVGDVDNDGDWDLYITDNDTDGPSPFGNVLYLGNAEGRLDDNSCDTAGVCGTNSWPCNFADFNRDGWVDLWVGTLAASDPEQLYLNDGDGTFTPAAATGFSGHEARGGSIADYDGDGDVDLVMVNDAENSVLMRNDSTDTNNWLQVKLFGVTSNRDAIGATVRVTAGGMTQMRRVSGGDSAHSQQELIVHFGLGTDATANVQVDWPNGSQQTFNGVVANQLVFVQEGTGQLSEILTASAATYSTSLQELTVTVSSNFGGRTAFDVAAFGPLAYEVAGVQFSAAFSPVGANPGNVTLTSPSGGNFVVPVTGIP